MEWHLEQIVEFIISPSRAVGISVLLLWGEACHIENVVGVPWALWRRHSILMRKENDFALNFSRYSSNVGA